MLAIELQRFVTSVSDGASATPTTGSETITQGQISVVLTSAEGRELFRANDVYDLEDEPRALAFLRASLMNAARKLTPVLPLVGTAPIPAPVATPTAAARPSGPTGARAGDPTAVTDPPAATRQVTPPASFADQRLRWRPLRRAAELSVAGFGVILLGVGASYGIQAWDWEQRYRGADTQLDAVTAKRRSEHEARVANRWLFAGGITTGVAAVALVLDLFGVFDRGTTPQPHRTIATPAAASLHLLPTDGGVVGVWSASFP
jgi:hypothetical protein